MKLQCNNCNHINNYADEKILFDFEVSEIEEKRMGPEKTHFSYVELVCENCSKSMEIKIDINEYPPNVYNSKEISVVNGNLIEEPNLKKYIDSISNSKF